MVMLPTWRRWVDRRKRALGKILGLILCTSIFGLLLQGYLSYDMRSSDIFQPRMGVYMYMVDGKPTSNPIRPLPIYTTSKKAEFNAPLMDIVFSNRTRSPTLVHVRRGLKRVLNFNQNVNLLSAIVGNSSSNGTWDTAFIQAWENKTFVRKKYWCCFATIDDRFHQTDLMHKVNWTYVQKANLDVKQFVCPLPTDISISNIQGVTLTGQSHKCIPKKNWYLPLEKAYKQPNSIGVCAKLVYGEIPADELLSWFEIHRRLGVDKVHMFTYNVNIAARRVLMHYQDQGLLDAHEFELPDEGTGTINPALGRKNMQAWNDEQLAVYECLERFRSYRYVIMLDVDEYLIPVRRNESLHDLFDRLFNEHPEAAGFLFLSQLHITSWGVTGDVKSRFNVMRYLNRTKSMVDRQKHVSQPHKLTIGGLSTHGFVPQLNVGKRGHASDTDVVLHHYRSCRHEWNKKNRKNTTARCEDLDRYTDPTVRDVFRPIEDKVTLLRHALLDEE